MASPSGLRAFLEAKLGAALPTGAPSASRVVSALESRAAAESEGGGDGGEPWRRSGRSAYANHLLREYGLLLCEHLDRVRKREAGAARAAGGDLTDEWVRRTLEEALEARRERTEVRRKSAFIRSHHARLRSESREVGADVAWARATDAASAAPASLASLEKYAECMRTVATRGWVRTGILWVVECARTFFSASAAERDGDGERGGARPGTVLERALARDERALRRRASAPPSDAPGARVAALEASTARLRRLEAARPRIDFAGGAGRRLRLLDVGSCYNPFSPESLRVILGRGDGGAGGGADAMFEVTALDLAPAHESVLQCDFLALEVGPPGSEPVTAAPAEGGGPARLLRLPKQSMDVVTLSLVLSYLPSPEQRASIVRKAAELLRRPPEGCGLLLILTPLSVNRLRCPDGDESACKLTSPSAQETVLARWQRSFEGMGLRRWKHDTLPSTYGLAYFVAGEEPPAGDGAPLPLPIAQDFRRTTCEEEEEEEEDSALPDGRTVHR